MTLLQLINTIKTIALAQPNIHSCVDEFLSLNDITAKYSAIILQQRNHQRNNDFISFNFYLGAADRLTEDKSNEIEVQSTAINTINNIVSKLEDLGFDTTMGSYNVFTERFLAESAGCYVELSINIPVGECEDDFSKEELNATITANGVYTWIPKGLGFENVKINVDVAHLQDKSLNITKNGNYKVQYDKGFSGIGTVDLAVNVPIPEINNQEKNITITQNGQTEIVPDTDYTGLSKVSVNTAIDTDEYYNEGYEKGREAGISLGVLQQKQKLTDITITENGSYSREDGYGSITVDVPIPEINNQEKNITITQNGQTEIVPDTDYTGLSKVSVNTAIDTQSYYDNGYSQGKIDGKEDGINEQKRKLTDITITENGSYSREDGYGSITVNVPTSGGGGIDLTSLGYTAQENTTINTDIQDSIAYSQSLLESYTNSTSYSGDNRITFVPLFPCSGRKIFNRMFSYCNSLTTLPALDTSSGTNFSGMFDGCSSLKFVSQLDTSKNTDFSYLFSNCKILTSIPALDTKKGNNFQYMFKNCYMLSSIPALDTSNTTSISTDFSFMFYGCRSLSTIPEINVVKGYDFQYMFYGCSSLVNIGNLHSVKGSNFISMFSACSNLETISLINIHDTDNSRDLLSMFEGCSKLKNITFEDSINADISFYYTKILTYNSIKSILIACAATTNSNSKTITFNQSIKDQNQELQNLVAQCTSKGWTVTGLTIQ